MAVFYVLLFVPIMWQHFAVSQFHIDYEKKNKRALAFFFIFFTLLVILRHERVGNDTKNYIYFFDEFSTAGWGELRKYQLEIGFSYLNKIISVFSKEAQVFLGIVSIITIAMIYPTYKRLCLDASLTIVLFCIMSTFVMMFSGIRQMIAVGIGIVAYEFARRKQVISFVLMVCLALLFHTSAFMLIFMYPLYHAKIGKKWLYAVVPGLTAVFVFNKPIFSTLSIILERYTDYSAGVSMTGAYTMLLLFVIFAVFSFVVPDESNLDEETIGLRNFLLMSILIQVFAPLHNLAMRMNYYYIIFIPLLLPKIIEAKATNMKQLAIVGRYVMIVFFLLYFFLIKANNSDNLHVFPYYFFWENVA